MALSSRSAMFSQFVRLGRTVASRKPTTGSLNMNTAAVPALS